MNRISYKNVIAWKKYSSLKYEITDGPYALLYFSENSLFLRDRDKLNIRQIDFRDIALANTNIPRTHITGKTIQEYRENRLIAHNVSTTNKSKNIILDPSDYLDSIDKKFSPVTYQNNYGNLVYSHILAMLTKTPVMFKKILMYSIVLNTTNRNYTKTKLFPFMESIKRGNIFFDDFVLCVINQQNVSFRVLIKDGKIDYEKFLYYIRNIKKNR